MKKITFLFVALCATVFANAADFEMAEAEFVYYAEYSTPEGYNFMVNLYSDMTWEENAETGGYVPTSEGNYFSLDVYTASASSFVGKYSQLSFLHLKNIIVKIKNNNNSEKIFEKFIFVFIILKFKKLPEENSSGV
jgi:hypothetical protein